MCVGKEDEIDWRKLGKRQRRFGQAFRADGKKWQANSDARKQNGIGYNRDTKEIDQDGGMSEPGRGEIVIVPGIRFRSRERRCDGPPAFHRPFPPKVAYPAASLNRAARRLAFRFH